jgi:phage baseplate assembly protein gpV
VHPRITRRSITNANSNYIGVSNLFSIDGQTLTFNGTTANFESNTKSYTVTVKASTGIVTGKNAAQTITVNLTDLNDETPTAINLTGNHTIAENTTIGTELGTLSATDADAGDTFTYTSSNTTFTLDNNKLKLNAALDFS